MRVATLSVLAAWAKCIAHVIRDWAAMLPLKFCPPIFLSSDADLKTRFEREARAISALSHPHICHLYDIGSQDGTDYLVMELLEGDSLADRLEKGALPLKQVLEYGIQIAEALERAHKNGIAHRDLKPSNIMLTKSGAKLMDFGLAKAAVTAVAAGSSSDSLTLTCTPGREKGSRPKSCQQTLSCFSASERTRTARFMCSVETPLEFLAHATHFLHRSIGLPEKH
jgi:serine/threonine protein kinase